MYWNNQKSHDTNEIHPSLRFTMTHTSLKYEEKEDKFNSEIMNSIHWTLCAI